MTTQILHGTREQIADLIAHTPGKIVEAILILEDPATPLTDDQFNQLLTEMDAAATHAGPADYSRESIYTRHEGE